MNRTALIAVALAVMLALAGCASAPGDEGDANDETTTTAAESDTSAEHVTRFVDEEAGVVCYKFDDEGATASGAGWQSGISCLPLNETNLETYDG